MYTHRPRGNIPAPWAARRGAAQGGETLPHRTSARGPIGSACSSVDERAQGPWAARAQYQSQASHDRWET
eukprot:2889772-Alexandrium_andersonii.AAC.1